MALKLHFCNDPTGWRYLIPALLDLPESQFQWETCRIRSGLTLAHQLLESDNFSFVPVGSEEYVAEWLDLYGLENLIQKVELHWWGKTDFNLESTQIPTLKSDINGFIFSLISRYPQHSLRSLLVRRGVHPIDRLKLRQILQNARATLQSRHWVISELPVPVVGLQSLLTGYSIE
jgi:hypothetical protein